jgi:deoxyadenosine/deoxycytidine kinase
MTTGRPQTTPRYIAVEGVIGAGKTTLATMLAERFTARLVLERFEENPFLEDFYRDQKRFAFQTQIFFLLSRYRQQQEFRQLDLFYDHVVSDYIFDKDKIFASLTLGDHEMSLYESVLAALQGSVPKPDLVIYLQSSVNRLVANIRNRGRAMEQSISLGYLRDLSEAYAHYFFHYTGAPVLIVNTANMDFVNDPGCFDDLVREIVRPSDARIRYYHHTRNADDQPAIIGG